MSEPALRPTASLRAGGWSRRRWLQAFAGFAGLTAVDAFGMEPRWLRTRSLRVGTSPTLRFAYFTDLHFKGDPALGNAVVERINRERPAFAAFGGDLVEDDHHLPGALDILSRIEVPVYGVPGNHDYWSGSDFGRIDEVLRRRGGRWLLDESIEVPGGGAHVTGHSCRMQPALAPRTGTKNLALIHYPVWADRLQPGWDLVLAGHSHGGQVRLPLLGALITPTHVGRYRLGSYETVSGPLYVSSGVGTLFVNVRFLCPPELVFVEV